MKQAKILIRNSRLNYRKLNASNCLIIPNAKQLKQNFRLLMETLEKKGVPIPSIVRNFSIFFQNYRVDQAGSQDQQVFKYIQIIKQGKQHSFQKTFFQENIEAAKSRTCSLTITKILDIIEQQKDVCLGCLSLEEGKPIPKTNQLYSLVHVMSINGVLQDNVKKKTCAILNDQGGYLFISESINKNSVKGLTLNQGELYQLRQFVHKTIKNSIFPDTFEVKIDQIKVTNKNNKNAKSILRVSLRPKGENGFYFVKKEVLNYPSVFTCYFLDLKAVGEINDICVLKQTENIYKILTKHRSLKNTEKIVHKFECIERSNAMRNLFNQINQCYPQQVKFKNILDEGPLIKFSNQTILILPTEADDNYIPQIIKAFENYRLQFAFSKTFQICRSNSIKSMWFLSHQKKLTELHQIITNVINDKNKTITMITCTKYLMIEKKQKKSFKHYLKTFKSYFQKNLIIYGVLVDSPKEIYNIYIKFETISESYFSFMLLDDERIRSKFIKEQKFNQQNKQQLNIE